MANVVVGVVVALMVFLAREQLFPPPQVGGKWLCSTKPTTPQQGVEDYVFVLYRHGREVNGSLMSTSTVARNYQDEHNIHHEFASSGLHWGDIEGAIRERIFRHDTVILLVDLEESDLPKTLLFNMAVLRDRYRRTPDGQRTLELLGEYELIETQSQTRAAYVVGSAKCVRPIRGISSGLPLTGRSQELDPLGFRMDE